MIYTAPLAILILIPGIYHLAKKIYATVATNRERIPCNDDNCVIGYPPSFVDSDEIKLLQNLKIRDIKVFGLVMFFIVFSFFQICSIFSSSSVVHFKSDWKLINNPVHFYCEKFCKATIAKTKVFFGITHHALFLDGHMNGYDHIITVVYVDKFGKTIWLPIMKQTGQPDWYLKGFNWTKWTFRVNSPRVNSQLLVKGVKDFTAFWAGKYNIELNNAQFKVLVKYITVPTKFEPNFLSSQMKKPWEKLANANWDNKEFSINYLQDISTFKAK